MSLQSNLDITDTKGVNTAETANTVEAPDRARLQMLHMLRRARLRMLRMLRRARLRMRRMLRMLRRARSYTHSHTCLRCTLPYTHLPHTCPPCKLPPMRPPKFPRTSFLPHDLDPRAVIYRGTTTIRPEAPTFYRGIRKLQKLLEDYGIPPDNVQILMDLSVTPFQLTIYYVNLSSTEQKTVESPVFQCLFKSLIEKYCRCTSTLDSPSNPPVPVSQPRPPVSQPRPTVLRPMVRTETFYCGQTGLTNPESTRIEAFKIQLAELCTVSGINPINVETSWSLNAPTCRLMPSFDTLLGINTTAFRDPLMPQQASAQSTIQLTIFHQNLSSIERTTLESAVFEASLQQLIRDYCH